jgi:hypothetical protein
VTGVVVAVEYRVVGYNMGITVGRIVMGWDCWFGLVWLHFRSQIIPSRLWKRERDRDLRRECSVSSAGGDRGSGVER